MIFRLIVVCAISLAVPAPAMAITLTGPASVSETAESATYTVTCSGGDVGPVTVSVDSGPAPAATEGDDYEVPSVLPILCVLGVPSAETVQVPILDDGLDETSESFTVSSGPLSPQSVETAIVDDDPIASIVPVVFVSEGDSGTAPAQLTVTLSSVPVETTTIAYETQGLSATTGPDFTDTSGNLVFNPGETTKTISVPVVGDTIAESPEAFFVNLLSTDNGSLNATAKQGAVGIFDFDEAALPTVSVPKSVTVDEGNGGNGNILFNVTLSSEATERTEVSWKSADWTANKGADYVSDSGKVVFQTGQKSKTISVDVKGDRRDEPDEAFTVTLSNPVAATLGRQASFGIIADDDGPVVKIGKPKVRGKRLVTKIACPDTADGCQGTLKTKVGKRKLRKASFDLENGTATKVRQKLPRRVRDAMAERRLRAKLAATAADASGDSAVTKRRSRLRRLQ